MDIQTIGIIGYGYVGQAVHAGFNKPTNRFVICDLKHNDNTVEDVVAAEPSLPACSETLDTLVTAVKVVPAAALPQFEPEELWSIQ